MVVCAYALFQYLHIGIGRVPASIRAIRDQIPAFDYLVNWDLLYLAWGCRLGGLGLGLGWGGGGGNRDKQAWSMAVANACACAGWSDTARDFTWTWVCGMVYDGGCGCVCVRW